MREVLVMVAPNGARLQKVDAPAVPVTPVELARTALACRDAGAAAMHMHVRDAGGQHSLQPEHYQAALDAVHEAVGDEMVVQVTSEAAGRYDWRAQMAMVRALRPAFVSLGLREFLPVDADAQRQAQVADFFRWMQGQGVSPQFILYAPEEVVRLADLVEQGVVPWRRPFVLFVLGRYGGVQAAPDMLDAFVAAFAPLRAAGAAWMACAFGAQQVEVLVHAARCGGHVRIGFENGREVVPGVSAPDNAALVHALVAQLRRHGMQPMPASVARHIMRLEK